MQHFVARADFARAIPIKNDEKDLLREERAARLVPRLKGLFVFLKTRKPLINTGFLRPRPVRRPCRLNALKRPS